VRERGHEEGGDFKAVIECDARMAQCHSTTTRMTGGERMAAPWQLDHEAAAAQRDGDVLAESAGGRRGRCGGGLPGAADGASGPAGRGALGGRGRVTSRSTTGAQPARRRTLARESVTYKSSFDFSFDRPRAVRALVGARPRREGEGGSLLHLRFRPCSMRVALPVALLVLQRTAVYKRPVISENTFRY